MVTHVAKPRSVGRTYFALAITLLTLQNLLMACALWFLLDLLVVQVRLVPQVSVVVASASHLVLTHLALSTMHVLQASFAEFPLISAPKIILSKSKPPLSFLARTPTAWRKLGAPA